MSKNSNSKKVTFTEEIDSAITGYSIGISFLCIGVFLLLKPDYFFHAGASYFVGSVMGCIGLVGAGIELSKSRIFKGMGNMTLGIVFLAIWLVIYLKVDNVWANCMSFVLLILGGCATVSGILQNIYSLFSSVKESKKKEKKLNVVSIISQTILFLTQLSALAVAAINAIKALSI